VDCNRNFNTPNWGKETYTATAQNMQQGDPTALLYFGPRQASEVETSNLAGWVAGLGNVAASIDYHSHGQLIILPTEAPVSSQHRRLGEALQLLITWSGSPPYDLGTAMQTVQYAALSSVMDSMAVHRNSRAFTVELDPGRNAGGNPFILPEAQIMRVFEKNIRGALTLIATAGNNPRSFWGGLCCCCSSPWASSVSRFEDWDVVGRGNQLPV
jgi:hypothetical protein